MFNQVNVQHIKDYFRKPIVLVLSIITFASIVVSYCSLIPMLGIFSDLRNFLELSVHSLSSQELRSYDSLTSFSISYTIICSVFSIAVASLPAVSWFIINHNSKKNNGKAPNAGFMILFILSIIGIVSAAIIIIYSLLIMTVISVFRGMESANYQSIELILLLLSMLTFAIGIMSLIYNILAVKFYSGVRKSSKRTNMVITGKGFGIFAIIYSIFSFFAVVATVGLVVLFLEIMIEEAHISNVKLLFDAFSDHFIVAGIILLASSLLSTVAEILLGKVAIGYYNMAKELPFIPEPPMYMQYNNQYNQSYVYPQQAPVNNVNYNNYQNTYQQPQYNQNYNPNPQPIQNFQAVQTAPPQQNNEPVNPEQNPYQE